MVNHCHYLTPGERKLLLQKLAQPDLRPEYYLRIKIMLMADEEQSQTQICQTLKCSKQTARYWMSMAQKGYAHCWNECPRGRRKIVNDRYLHRLQVLLKHSPRDYGYCFKNWTAKSLARHLAKELGIEMSDRHISRLLKNLGLSTRQLCSSTQNIDLPATQNAKATICDLPSFVVSGNR